MAIPTAPRLDVSAVRAEFPALDQRVHGRPLVYLDNAATTQKPQTVIDAIRRYYETDNANVHRGVHTLSERATADYEAAREAVRAFINARSTAEIVFTRNATEAINLVARAWGDANVRAGDEVLITGMEHHSNIVPWQQLASRTGAVLRAVPIDDRGELRLEDLDHLLTARTRMVAVVHLSNVLGTINPVRRIVARAKQAGAAVLIDGSQAVGHMAVDVQAIGADFYVFTGHKLYGPMGIGVLHGSRGAARGHAAVPRRRRHDPHGHASRGAPGTTCRTSSRPARPTWRAPSACTAAIDYLTRLGFEAITAHEHALLDDATAKLAAVEGLR